MCALHILLSLELCVTPHYQNVCPFSHQSPDTIGDDPNVLVQLFSPLVASQRIMFCQFDNSYTSLECADDMNFVFEEFLGYLLLQIGNESVQTLQRIAGVALTMMKRVCGPDLSL